MLTSDQPAPIRRRLRSLPPSGDPLEARTHEAVALAERTGDLATFVWAEPHVGELRTRLVAPGRGPIDVRTPDGNLTVERLIAGARRLLAPRQFAGVAAVISAAREGFDLSPEQEQVLAGIEEYVTQNAECDHTRHCCTEHGVHSSPHIGCILR